MNNKYFEYKHIVSFEETNLVGNVYFANHVRWQGRVREMFINQYAPDVLQALNSISLVTMKVSCEYYQELFALDEVIIRMKVINLTQNKVTMKFEYYRQKENLELIAVGEQQIACMKKIEHNFIPEKLPQSLYDAVYSFL
jgi:enediyne core biosynthesis thioesterase